MSCELEGGQVQMARQRLASGAACAKAQAREKASPSQENAITQLDTAWKKEKKYLCLSEGGNDCITHIKEYSCSGCTGSLNCTGAGAAPVIVI